MPIPISNFDLYDIVERENQEHFRSHFRASAKPGEASISLGFSDKVVGTSRASTSKAFSHHGWLASGSFIGSSTDGPIIRNLESEIILTSEDPSIGGKVAVGHVIASDFRSYSSASRTLELNSWCDDKEKLPVILAIGSNFSQGASHLTGTVKTFGPSGMAEELTALMSRILSLHPLAAVLKTDANLVLAHFFPWITNRSWSSLSLFEQVVLLQSHGYANPIEVIGRLFLRLRPHLLAVIFHGGPDFVHLYASEWISTYVDTDPISSPLIVFSDNLSGRSKMKGTTASLFI